MKVKAFYSVDEVAALLDVHRNTVLEYIKEGKLESERVGRRHMIPLSSLTAMASVWESIQIVNATKR